MQQPLFGVALSVGGSNNHVDDQGSFSAAVSFFGDNNTVIGGRRWQPFYPPPVVPGFASLAFNAFGSGNTVTAGGSILPLAIAGSIFQNGQTVTKVGTGFNINGVVVGGAAAIRNAKTSAPTATAVRTGKGTASAATSVGVSKRTAASAASVAHGK